MSHSDVQLQQFDRETFYRCGGHTSYEMSSLMNETASEVGYLLHKNHPHNLESDMADYHYSPRDMLDVFEALLEWLYDYDVDGNQRYENFESYDIDYLEDLESKYNNIVRTQYGDGGRDGDDEHEGEYDQDDSYNDEENDDGNNIMD